jgi:hypothetical protein
MEIIFKGLKAVMLHESKKWENGMNLIWGQ